MKKSLEHIDKFDMVGTVCKHLQNLLKNSLIKVVKRDKAALRLEGIYLCEIAIVQKRGKKKKNGVNKTHNQNVVKSLVLQFCFMSIVPV